MNNANNYFYIYSKPQIACMHVRHKNFTKHTSSITICFKSSSGLKNVNYATYTVITQLPNRDNVEQSKTQTRTRNGQQIRTPCSSNFSVCYTNGKLILHRFTPALCCVTVGFHMEVYLRSPAGDRRDRRR